MRILYTNFHQYHKGGHATYILNLYKALKEKYLIHIADPATSGLNQAMREIAPDCVFSQNFPKRITKIASIFKEAWRLRKLIKKNRYDIIHVNGSPDLQIAIIACILLRPRPALFYTKHNSIPISRNIFSLIKFKCAKEIIVVCGCQEEPFVEVGIPENRLTIIKNGLDMNHFAPILETTRNAMRAKLGFHADDLVFVSNAGTSPYKRWDCMVEAISQINNPKVKILIIGGNPTPDEIARYVTRFNMDDKINFIKEVIDTRPYIAAGDIGFVLSDSIETVSFACREMMSMGKPMIVSDFACLPENVKPGHNGWVMPRGDVASLSRIIKSIIARQEALPEMGKQARMQALKEFGIHDFAKATANVYEKALLK